MTEQEIKDLKDLEYNASEISEEIINPTDINAQVISDYLKSNFDIETVDTSEFLNYLATSMEVDIMVYAGRKLKGLPINKEVHKDE